MNCLIIEDEPLAATILEDYIREVSWLRFSGRCSDAHHAYEALQQQPVELLFLDIHLPGLKGLDFLRSLEAPPQTILTTAYQEYALDGFNLNVVDYLLKPIDFDRFLIAIQKLRRQIDSGPTSSTGRAFHFFNVNKKMTRVWLDEVVFAESQKEYIRLYMVDGRTLVTKGQIAKMEKALGLWRVHRSFLIALNQVDAYTSTEITVDNKPIPIGRQYKEQTLEKLAQYSAGN